MTLAELAATLGLKGPDSLRMQIKRGVLQAEKVGSGARALWLIKAEEAERYTREHAGKSGFASPDHPLHGKRGGGGRTKKND